MSGVFNQTLEGGIGNDVIGGGNGNDWIDGGDGNDTIGAIAGNDSVFGGNGDDAIDGGTGADTVVGGSGNDLLQGGEGTDSIVGGIGADTLYGGDGTDLLVGGAGNDWLDFGAGNDAYSYLNTDSFGSETLVGGTGTNSLLLGSDWVAGADQGGFNVYSRADGSILFTQGWSMMSFVENNGGVALVKNAVGQVFAKVGAAAPDDITFGVSQVNEISGPWRVMAAEAIGGVNKVATRHDSGALSIWQVDANWNFVAQDAFVGGTSAAAFALETSFQTDLNGDGIVGSPSAMPEDLKLLGAGEVLIGGIGDWNI